MLTVARGCADKARELLADGAEDMESFLIAVNEHAKYVLSQTPEMLPVLKQAGVVDSGGQGLVEVLMGAFDIYMGKEVDLSLGAAPVRQTGFAGAAPSRKAQEADIKFGYCTEFIILLNKAFPPKVEKDFKAYLESIGDSLVCVADGDIVKVHIHTNDPGIAIQKALKYGALSNMKIDNMRLEHQEKLFKQAKKEEERVLEAAVQAANEPPKPIGFIAVSTGDGLNEIFKSMGADSVIEGGQTMNPSTEDILKAVESVNAKTVFILPNNKNIILAANQAAQLVKGKTLRVIPTKTIPQGITAIINFVPDLSVEENEAAMFGEIAHVKTGEVTYAVRDTVFGDKEIKKDDYMGIGDDGILAVGQDMDAVTEEMVAAMVDEGAELISIYYGADVGADAAEGLCQRIRGRYSGCDVELQYGGQPIYYYVISVE